MSRSPSPSLGAQVQAERQARNLSTYALAERAGVSHRSIGGIERDEPVPAAHLEAVCRTLDLEVPSESAEAPCELSALQTFGRLLQQRRDAAGLSRLVLAQQARVSDAMILLVETARCRPSRTLCLRLIRIPELGLTWADVEPLAAEPSSGSESRAGSASHSEDETSQQSAPSAEPAHPDQAPSLPAISAQLQHAAEAALRIAWDSPVTLRTLGAGLGRLAAHAGESLRQALAPRHVPEDPAGSECITLPIGVTLEQAERELIRCTFAACGYSRQLTAEKLGISRRSLYYKLHEHKIPLS